MFICLLSQMVLSMMLSNKTQNTMLDALIRGGSLKQTNRPSPLYVVLYCYPLYLVVILLNLMHLFILLSLLRHGYTGTPCTSGNTISSIPYLD